MPETSSCASVFFTTNLTLASTQLMDMANLVATTQAQNQALIGQVSALSQQVAHLATAPVAPPQAPVPPPQPAAAAAATAQVTAVPQPPVASAPAPAPAPTPAPVVQNATLTAVPVAASDPVTAAPVEAPAPAAAPKPTPVAPPVDAEAAAAQAQVQQLSAAAEELQSLFTQLAAKTGGAVATPQPPAAQAQQQQRPMARGPQQSDRRPQRQEDQRRGKPVGGAPEPQPSSAAEPQPQPPSSLSGVGEEYSAAQPRVSGRGGRYVGPPRGSEQTFPQRQAATTPQPRAAAPEGMLGSGTASIPQDAAAAPTAPAAATAPAAGDGAAQGGAAGSSPLMEARIRGCRTALELKALLETPGRLAPADAVLAAQQLPRFARSWQQQQAQGQQQPQTSAAGPGGKAGAAAKRSDPEAAAIEELLGRLLSRFTSPAALQNLRRAFLPNYLALLAVCTELRMAPSRAFAGAVRQLVTEHVDELDPATAAAGVAAVAALDGTVAPGVLARVCKLLTDSAAALASPAAASATEAEAVAADGAEGTASPVAAQAQGPKRFLMSGRALVAAGQVAALGPAEAEAARQVLAAAGSAAAARPSPPRALCNAEALTAAAAGVLACVGAGVQVPAALLKQMEVASLSVDGGRNFNSSSNGDRGSDGRGKAIVLGDMSVEGQLLLARAFVATAHQPEERWLRAWERAVVGSGLPAATPAQVAALAAALHALSRSTRTAAPSDDKGTAPATTAPVVPRPRFVAAAAERLHASSGGVSQAGGAAALCALTLHLGELVSSTSSSSSSAAPRIRAEDQARAQAQVQAVGEALLAAVTAPGALAGLDAPDLAALAAGLSLMQLRLPAEVWSAALSRATDAPALAAALTGAARRGMELGLPAGIKLPAFDHFLSMAGQHVSGLEAPALVGLLGLAAAVRGSLRPALAATALTRLAETAPALGPADAAFLLATVDALGLNLAAPLVARPLAVAGVGSAEAGAGGQEPVHEAALTPAAVLRRVADGGALEPRRVAAELGLERCAVLVELVARLQQAADAAEAEARAEAAAALAPATADEQHPHHQQAAQTSQPGRLVSQRQLEELLELLQPSLQASASPAALVALASGAAALEVALSPAWLAAFVAAARAALPDLDPLTSSRIAVALTRCEQLASRSAQPAATGAGEAEGTVRDAVAEWMGEYVADQQRKMAAAPPAALALTVQVVAARGLSLPEGWLQSFLAACTPSLEAPLPLTQAQAAGAAAAAAAVASSRGRPAAPRPGAAGGLATSAAAASAASFTPSQLATLLRCLADLQQQARQQPAGVVPAAWLALAARQVEGRLVHFSHPDLAEALYGMMRLGGAVHEGAANQLVILSQGGGKLAVASPVLLAHTLAPVAVGEGRKVSPRWWEEVQRVAAAQLRSLGAAPASDATAELASVVMSLLTLRRDKAGTEFSEQLSSAMAAAVCGDGDAASGAAAGALAAALPAAAATMYVEAAAREPRGLGQRVPPAALLQTYLQHSNTLLGAWTATAVAANASAASEDEATATAASSASSVPAKAGGRDAKRARAHSAKRADKRSASSSTGSSNGRGLPAHLVEHLSSALAVGRLLVALPSAQQPAAAGPWLLSLVAAGAAAAESLDVADAAEVLWLVATLSRSGGGAGAGVVAAQQQVAALAARVNGEAPGAAAPGAAGRPSGRLSPDAAVNAVWALRVLKLMPSSK